MKAAVYRGGSQVRCEEVPVPEIGPGELLLRVEASGICGTDLKKILHDDLSPPRIFGHEVGGRVAAVGAGVTRWKPGDRALFFHHIPCRACSLCRQREYAQCAQYQRVGTTAGFEPAGGGWAEQVRVMDWIVREGLVRIPEGADAEEAVFVEPVNTCLKGIEKAGPLKERSVRLFGAGPVGLLLLQLARLEGARVRAVDPIEERRAIALELGAESACAPAELPEKEGADVALVAAASAEAVRAAVRAVRPAGRVVLFAQTRLGEEVPLDVGEIGKLEKQVIGSYSASVDLQQKAADLVFNRALRVKPLISHRFPLERIDEALRVAGRPTGSSLKVILTP